MFPSHIKSPEKPRRLYLPISLSEWDLRARGKYSDERIQQTYDNYAAANLNRCRSSSMDSISIISIRQQINHTGACSKKATCVQRLEKRTYFDDDRISNNSLHEKI